MGRFPAQGITTLAPRTCSWSTRIRGVALSRNFMLIRKLSLNMLARPDINAKLSRKAITIVISHCSLSDEATICLSVLDPRSSILDQMQRGVFGHAGAARRRCVNDELIGRFSRFHNGVRRLSRRFEQRWLYLLFFRFYQSLADEQAVEDHTGSDQDKDYSEPIQAANDIRAVPGSLRHSLEEKIEKDHRADAGENGEDAVLDLTESFLFGRGGEPFPSLLWEGLRPGLVPIELLIGRRGCHRFARATQVGAALLAEFEIIADLNTTYGTEHNNSSCYLRQSVSRRSGVAIVSVRCKVESSVTLATFDGAASTTR